MILDETYRKCKQKIDFIKKKKASDNSCQRLKLKTKAECLNVQITRMVASKPTQLLVIVFASGEVICEPAR
jgi:hypothetical protein